MKKRKNLFSAALFLLGLVLLMLFASWLFYPKDNTLGDSGEDLLSDGFLAEPRGSLDLLVLGDSVPKYGVQTPLLWCEFGIPGYTNAPVGDTMPKILERANSFFARQTPKVVLLESTILFRNIEPGYAAQLGAERLFPVLRFHDNWKFFSLGRLLRPVHYTEVMWEKGYYVCGLYQSVESVPQKEMTGELGKGVYENLQQLEALCRKNGARLILFSLPSTQNMNAARHDTLEQTAARLGIPYLDMNRDETVDIDWSTETENGGDHLNYWGAQKATRALGDYLKGLNLLPDHRGEAAYAAWDACEQIYEEPERIPLEEWY